MRRNGMPPKYAKWGTNSIWGLLNMHSADLRRPVALIHSRDSPQGAPNPLLVISGRMLPDHASISAVAACLDTYSLAGRFSWNVILKNVWRAHRRCIGASDITDRLLFHRSRRKSGGCKDHLRLSMPRWCTIFFRPSTRRTTANSPPSSPPPAPTSAFPIPPSARGPRPGPATSAGSPPSTLRTPPPPRLLLPWLWGRRPAGRLTRTGAREAVEEPPSPPIAFHVPTPPHHYRSSAPLSLPPSITPQRCARERARTEIQSRVRPHTKHIPVCRPRTKKGDSSELLARCADLARLAQNSVKEFFNIV